MPEPHRFIADGGRAKVSKNAWSRRAAPSPRRSRRRGPPGALCRLHKRRVVEQIQRTQGRVDRSRCVQGLLGGGQIEIGELREGRKALNDTYSPRRYRSAPLSGIQTLGKKLSLLTLSGCGGADARPPIVRLSRPQAASADRRTAPADKRSRAAVPAGCCSGSRAASSGRGFEDCGKSRRDQQPKRLLMLTRRREPGCQPVEQFRICGACAAHTEVV